MSFVVYTLAAVAFVLSLAWVLYVAPTPGPLSLTALAGALVPSFAILALAAAVLGVMAIARMIVRAIRGRR
jgi:hypothetical protein